MKSTFKSISHLFLVLTVFFSVNAQQRIFTSARAQVEAVIAVNPTNPQNLVGTAITIFGSGTQKQISYYYTFDGGNTWNGAENTLGDDGGDPVIAFDPDGVAYLLYQKRSEGKLLLHISNDGGISWNDPPMTVVDLNTANQNVDRPWMAISPIRNQDTKKFNIYISYSLQDVSTNSFSIVLLRSRDGGSSFIEIQQVEPDQNHVFQGSSVAVDPDGKVYLAWAELNSNAFPVEKIHVQLYANDGTILESQYTKNTQQIGQEGTAGPNKQYFVKNGKVRVDSYPRIAIDHSLNPATHSWAYIVWAGKLDQNFDSEILMIRRKKDTSGTWVWDDSKNVLVNPDLQWQPAPSVSPDGVLSVLLFYSPSDDYNVPITVRLRKSVDGGESFSGNTLNDSGFILFPGDAPFDPLLGDYHGLTSWRGKVYGLWSEYDTEHAPDHPIQLYFRSFDVTELPLPGNYSKVIVDQLDEGNQSFGKVGRWNQGEFTDYSVPYEFVFEEATGEVLRAAQTLKSGTTQKYHQWENINDVINHREFIIENNQNPIISLFKTAHPATIRNELVSAPQNNGGEIEFKDPWLVLDGNPDYYDSPYGYRNLGQQNAIFEPNDSPFNPNTNPGGPGSEYKGVFLNQTPDPHDPNKPYYSVRAPFAQTFPVNGEDITWYFQNWEVSGATLAWPDSFLNGYFESPVVFENPNAAVTARYKGHLRTSLPGLGDAKNQRRVISAGNLWNMIYEDAGDIWLTYSTDGGATWEQETRINFRQGKAFNPTLSNIFTFASNSHDSKRYVIAWVEKNDDNPLNVHYELHMQTMKLGYPHYGWSNYSDDDRTYSHRIISDHWSPVVAPNANARISMNIRQSGNNALLTYAHEHGQGIVVDDLLFEGNGYNSLNDLDQVIFSLGGPYAFSSKAGSQCPVVIYQPAVYGQTATTYIYYIEPLKASYSRIIQATWPNLVTSTLDIPQEYYGYRSLQGTISAGNGIVALTAEAERTSGVPGVVYYTKLPHESLPAIRTVFYGMEKPTIMAENSSGYGTITTETMMRSTESGNWYTWPGVDDPVFIFSEATGVYSRAVVESGDRVSMATRTSTDPAKLEHYSGSGVLNKGRGVSTDVWLFGFWQNTQNDTLKAVLDFTGAEIEVLDSLKAGLVIAAVRFVAASPEDVIVRQPDSLQVPLGVDVQRNGETVYSFEPTSWQTLTLSSIPGLQSGDVLIFHPDSMSMAMEGYPEVLVQEGALGKRNLAQLNGDKLPVTETAVDVYPNPFNPATTFKIALPRPAEVRLEIYNLLGQRVETVYAGRLQAGKSELRFDGSRLSSGIYFYRFSTTKHVKSGRLLLMK